MIMFGWVPFVFLGLACAADVTPLQTSSIGRIDAITAYGNTLAVGYHALSTSAEATGGVYISYYDDSSGDYNLQTSGTLSETKLLNPYIQGEFGNPRTDANGNAGFGKSLAMSSDTELFISAASLAMNTGRGNNIILNASFTCDIVCYHSLICFLW